MTAGTTLAAVNEEHIHRLPARLLAYSDETFQEALKIGFGSAIRREWAWREKRGESLANLRAFAGFVAAPGGVPGGAAAGSDQGAGPP